MSAVRPLARTWLTTGAALVAFAANSVLARLALGAGALDAASFTAVRLLSGALTLTLVLRGFGNGQAPSRGSWTATVMLFLYAVSFSFAYLTLETGTGALLLFGAVQLTMILTAVARGERLRWAEWCGLALAFAGFVWLVLPRISTPSFVGFVLMTTAGTAWGVYTVLGQDSSSPLADTVGNFLRTAPLAAALAALAWGTGPGVHLSWAGVGLAAASGAVASGLGYTVWYVALGGLSTTQAAVAQLAVPVLAALGGVALVSEALSWRLALASAMVLGGIAWVVLGRRTRARVTG